MVRVVAVNRAEYPGSFWFPVTPPQMWAIIEQVDRYESWQSWLAGFRAEQGGLLPGSVLHATVLPPVPHRAAARRPATAV